MFDRLHKRLFLRPSTIKIKNERYLLSQGARICKGLPYTGHTAEMKTSVDLGRRAAIVCGFFNIYLGVTTQAIKKWLEGNNLMSYVSSEEASLLRKNEKDISENEMCDISWYIESLYALLWAGSVFDDLNVQKHVPDALVNFIPNIQNKDIAGEFIKPMKIRPYGQIYKMLDLYYRSHWYVRDAGLCCEDTKGFDFSTIMARRRALEWVFYSGHDWDNVDLST